jgi:hypothetical protein
VSKVLASCSDLREKLAAKIVAIMERKLKQRRMKEIIYRRIIKAMTINLEAQKVRVWRQ